MPIPAEKIVEYLQSEAGRPLKAKELANELGVATADYAEFKDLLQRLEDEGRVYRQRHQRYAAPDRINLVVGRLQTTRAGAGFVVPESGGGDLYIPQALLIVGLLGIIAWAMSWGAASCGTVARSSFVGGVPPIMPVPALSPAQ